MIYCFAWTIFYFIAGSVSDFADFFPFPPFHRLAIASVSHPYAGGWAIAAVEENNF